MSGGLITPQRVDGRVEWHDNRDLTDRLRNGDATLGWEGDPTMRLLFNGKATPPQWEVWGRQPDGFDGLLMWRPVDGKPPGIELIRAIVAHDTRHIDVVGDTIRAEEQRLADLKAKGREQSTEMALKLHHAIAKDLDLPAPAGRFYGLSGR